MLSGGFVTGKLERIIKLTDTNKTTKNETAKPSSAANVRRETATCVITDFDIATVEALHDLLLDKHNYSLNHITLANARVLTNKMYKAFESA